ncbi:MAG: TIGR03557 family F420-dependent LLM class oxidoreductase [Candidatus Rokuibacteriota bacterium]
MAFQIGYQLSCEEHRPNDLVRNAQKAEEHGFAFATISDHFHPWIDAQGQSPFVWSVIGGIARATERLGLGTWVTCPTTRLHPAVVAQAAATSAAMMPGRFFLGVGTGENLNEHIVGQGWPETEVRQARLEEAIAVIRLLWQGGNQSHHGRFFTVENARLYTLPEQAPPLLVAMGGPKSAEMAGRLGDGLIATDPEAELVRVFAAAGGRGKPRYGSVTVCWARDEKAARKTAHRIWPTAAMESSLSWELPLPQHFADAAKLVTEDAVAEAIVCGPDPEKYVTAIKKYVEAGFDHVAIHQVGPDQAGFFAFYAKELAPALMSLKPTPAAKASPRPQRHRAA